jgi:hypothetical protein
VSEVSAEKERDRLKEAMTNAVAEADRGESLCPINNGKQKNRGDSCSRCGAGTSDICEIINSANDRGIEMIREALRESQAPVDGEDIDILGARAIIARVSGWIENNDPPDGDWDPLVEDIARNLRAIRAHRPATADQPKKGE